MGIRYIIAMSPAGIPYFGGNYVCPMGRTCDFAHKDSKVKDDPTLLSGLFSVITKMAEFSGGELQHIKFEKFHIFLLSSDEIIMVMGTDPTEEIKDYKNRLRLSLEIFLEKFSQYLPDQASNTALFNSFQMKLEEANIFDAMPKYRKNCIDCSIDRDCMYRMVSSPLNMDPFEKMKKGEKRYSIFHLIYLWLVELIKYFKQYKKYKRFKEKYQKQKQMHPNQDITFLDDQK